MDISYCVYLSYVKSFRRNELKMFSVYKDANQGRIFQEGKSKCEGDQKRPRSFPWLLQISIRFLAYLDTLFKGVFSSGRSFGRIALDVTWTLSYNIRHVDIKIRHGSLTGWWTRWRNLPCCLPAGSSRNGQQVSQHEGHRFNIPTSHDVFCFILSCWLKEGKIITA